MDTGADHTVVWAKKDLKMKFRRKQITRKGVWKNFTLENLEREAGLVNWGNPQEISTRAGLEDCVEKLEDKIKQVMEKVAQMKTVEKARKSRDGISVKNSTDEYFSPK